MSDKVLLKSALANVLDEHRKRRKQIVFTNGCFDLLHVGHVRYLTQARALGDLLVVGVNSDSSVRALKGPDRPLIPQDERAELLAALECVDYICIFDELRPDSLIEAVRPNVHVKGGDYREEDLPEASIVRQHGGRIAIMPIVEGKSTTNVIARILEIRDRKAR